MYTVLYGHVEYFVVIVCDYEGLKLSIVKTSIETISYHIVLS
jgi:hypothetical protein